MTKPAEMLHKEKIVITSILYGKESREYALGKEIKDVIFEDEKNKAIMQAFNAFASVGIDPTETLIAERISPKDKQKAANVLLYLKQLRTECPAEPKEALEIHLDILKKEYRMKHYKKVFAEVSRRIDAAIISPLSTEFDEIERFIETALYEMEDTKDKDEIKAMDLLTGYHFLLNKLKEAVTSTESELVTSGYAELDKVLNGGFKKGTFALIAARPGMGKTVWMLNSAVEAARTGKKVLFISIEMNLLQCFQRVVSKIAQITGKKLQQPELLLPEDKEALKKAGKEIKEFYQDRFWIEEVTEITVPQLERKIKQYKKQHQIDIVYVDYAQILLTKEGNEPKEPNDFAQISGALRRASKSQDVAIVVGSQLNREVEKRENKRPIMADIRNSGAFEQDAAQIIGLYRDEAYHAAESEKPNIIELIFLKNRFGKANVSIEFNYDFEKQMILSKAVA